MGGGTSCKLYVIGGFHFSGVKPSNSTLFLVNPRRRPMSLKQGKCRHFSSFSKSSKTQGITFSKLSLFHLKSLYVDRTE